MSLSQHHLLLLGAARICSFQKAVDRNNDAATLVERGNYKEAIGALTSSLNSFKTLLVALHEESSMPSPLAVDSEQGDKPATGPSSVPEIGVERDNGQSSCEAIDVETSNFSMLGNEHAELDPELDDLESDDPKSDTPVSQDKAVPSMAATRPIQLGGKNLHIYQQLLLLETDQTDFLREPEDCLAMLTSNSAIVMFNMALAMHLAVLDQSCTSYDWNDFYQVERLYVLTFELLVESEIECMVLVVNNLGVLHMQLNESTKALDCFQYVLMALMYMIDRGLCVGRNERLDSLLHNSFLLVTDFRNNCRFAAAA